MRILPRQLQFDNDIPTIAGNADYAITAKFGWG